MFTRLILDIGTDEDKMKAAGKYFRNGKNLLSRFPSNLPMVGISKPITFDYYQNYKSDFEIAVLCAYLAIKSILGSKPYVKATNDYLICRMAGYSKIDELPDELPAPLSRFTTRRMLDKIKLELQTGWNVNIYAKYTRGFYISIDAKFSLEKLVLEVEKRREKHIQADLRDRVERARMYRQTWRFFQPGKPKG